MMKKSTRALTALCLSALILTAASCSQEEAAVEIEQPAISVTVETASLTDERVTRSFTGSLEGERQADIYAKIAEAVDRVAVREGDRVKEGQIIVKLDKTGPTSNYRNAESVYRNAEKNFHKMDYLFKEGAISESQFDAAKTEFEISEASFEAAGRLIDVESPISGFVTSLDVSPGDMVYMGQKLATVASTDKMRVKIAVNSRDVLLMNEGDAVTVSASELSDAASGKIVAVARSADPDTRSFQVEVLMDNSSGAFRPGMFARIETVVEELGQVVTMPRPAVVILDGQETVFVVNDQTAHKRRVVLGSELDGRVVIAEGLQPGERVVTLGQTYLDEGFKVKITGEEKDNQ